MGGVSKYPCAAAGLEHRGDLAQQRVGVMSPEVLVDEAAARRLVRRRRREPSAHRSSRAPLATLLNRTLLRAARDAAL
jgi:hypothetical protein